MVGFYRFKFYMNAMHKTMFNNRMGELHPHTWQIVVDINQKCEEIFLFHNVEKEVKDFIDRYEGCTLNEVDPFNGINPTMENITLFFYKKINEILLEINWDLVSLKISENPTRTYVVKDTSGEVLYLANDGYKELLENENEDLIKNIKDTANYEARTASEMFELASIKIKKERDLRKKRGRKRIVIFCLVLLVCVAGGIYLC